MRILQIVSSLNSTQGHSSRLGDELVAGLRLEAPLAELVVRDLARDPVPHLTAARFKAFTTPEKDRNEDQRAAVGIGAAQAAIRRIVDHTPLAARAEQMEVVS